VDVGDPLNARKAENECHLHSARLIALSPLFFRRIIARAGARYVRPQIREGGRDVGAGGGSGVLTYSGRDYPFRVSGLSLGVTAGYLSVGWKDGLQA